MFSGNERPFKIVIVGPNNNKTNVIDIQKGSEFADKFARIYKQSIASKPTCKDYKYDDLINNIESKSKSKIYFDTALEAHYNIPKNKNPFKDFIDSASVKNTNLIDDIGKVFNKDNIPANDKYCYYKEYIYLDNANANSNPVLHTLALSVTIKNNNNNVSIEQYDIDICKNNNIEYNIKLTNNGKNVKFNYTDNNNKNGNNNINFSFQPKEDKDKKDKQNGGNGKDNINNLNLSKITSKSSVKEMLIAFNKKLDPKINKPKIDYNTLKICLRSIFALKRAGDWGQITIAKSITNNNKLETKYIFQGDTPGMMVASVLWKLPTICFRSPQVYDITKDKQTGGNPIGKKTNEKTYNSLIKQLKKCKKQNIYYRSINNKLQDDNNTLLVKNEISQEQNEKLQEKNNTLKNEKNLALDSKSIIENENDNFKKKIEELIDSNKILQEQNEKLQEENDKLKYQIEELKEKFDIDTRSINEIIDEWEFIINIPSFWIFLGTFLNLAFKNDDDKINFLKNFMTEFGIDIDKSTSSSIVSNGGYFNKYLKYKFKYFNKQNLHFDDKNITPNDNINYFNKYLKYKNKYLSLN